MGAWDWVKSQAKHAIGFTDSGSWNPIQSVKEQIGMGGGPPPTDLTKTPDAQALRDYAQQLLAERNSYVPPQVSGARSAGQLQAEAMLRGAANGEAPSAAEMLFRKGTDEGVNNAMGMATALQGSNPGAAIRAGLAAGSQAASQNAAGAAAIRAQEMATGRSQYADFVDALRREHMQADVANQGAGLQYKLGSANTALAALEAPLSTQVANEQLKQQYNAANQASTGQLLQTAGPLIAASDERVKTGIADAKPAADAFLESLKPKSFDYKDPSAPGQYPGHQLGVIAQDMMGGVATGPDGKKWISADVIGRVLAGMGRLNQKVEAIGG